MGLPSRPDISDTQRQGIRGEATRPRPADRGVICRHPERILVVLEARKTPQQPDGTYAVRVDLTIGAPLMTVPGT